MTGTATEIRIDLDAVDYIDSSALGALLTIRQDAARAGKALSLANPKGNVRQVLDIANFHRLFSIV